MANILGINLSALSEDAVLKKISDFLNDGGQHYIVTPNPEIILCAHKDEELFYILNKADLAVADGFGLKLAGLLIGEKIPRLTGADLSIKVLELARREKIKVMLLNWHAGLSSSPEIREALEKKFAGLDFSVLDIDRVKLLTETDRDKIRTFGPEILFTNIGFPYQEKILFHNLKYLPTVRIGLGVGGAFDFISGEAKRAPRLLRLIGLEWLWRLIRQPKRWRRIYDAVFVFSAKMIKARFINTYLYRANVACLLYKRENGLIKILLVSREDDPGHWQMPQGGRDGEDVATAGARELREETGVKSFVTRATFKNLHRYEFNSENGKQAYRGATPQRHVYESKKYRYDYKGQNQSLYIAEFLGKDEEIRINFWDHTAWKWVDADRLVEEIHPVRQAGTKIFLDKFRSLDLKKY